MPPPPNQPARPVPPEALAAGAHESASPNHLSAAEFRARGHELVDLLADYWQALQAERPPWPVRSANAPGALLEALPALPPEHPEPWPGVVDDLHRLILPGLTHWQSPSFFGYFPANASGPAVLAELLSAGLGVQGMLWSTSPACTELETRVLDWLAHATGLGECFRSTAPDGGGVIQGTASEGALVALVAARDHARRELAKHHRPAEPAPSATPPTRQQPAPPSAPSVLPWVVYTSTQAHSSIVKAAMIAGLADSPDPIDGFIAGPGAPGRPAGGVRLIATDAMGRIDTEALARAIAADRAAGRAPLFVAATLGTTATGAFDDLPAITRLARQHALWLHVDAAWAGSAWVCPELRPPPGALDAADSVVFNPHKWLLTNFDCSLLYTRRRAALTAALSITPEYLRNAASQSGQVIDYRDWQIPLGRRFRALKLWLVLRHYGLVGLRAHIREHLRLAGLFESLLRTDQRFEQPVPRSLSLVCFRLRGHDDQPTRRLLDRLNNQGRLFLSHAMLPTPAASTAKGPGDAGAAPGPMVLRLAIGATFTREQHIRQAWEQIRTLADDRP
jgi:aromatic-L-amino-acid decarboxylase